MEVTVNGEKRQLPEGLRVSQLLETLNVAPERVVVELNLTILKRAALVGSVLKEGDQVEIVHFVGGGSSDCWRLEAGGWNRCLQPFTSSLQPRLMAKN